MPRRTVEMPTEWEFKTDELGDVYVWEEDYGRVCYPEGDSCLEYGQLIAAAPKLYAALKQAYVALVDAVNNGPAWQENAEKVDIPTIQAAIRQAEGRDA